MRRLSLRSFDSVFFRTSILAAAAVTLSFLIGQATSFVAADIAALWALLAVRSTFHVAVKDAAVKIVATVIGAVVGYMVIQSYGFNEWLLLGMILFSFALGYILRLGVEGSVIVGFTMVLVASSGLSFETTEARVSGVILGTVIATVFSLFTSRGTPQKRLGAQLDSLRERKQKVLTQLSEAVAAGDLSEAAIFGLKVQAKVILEDAEEAFDNAEELVSASRWSPLTSKEEAVLLLDAARRAKEDAVTVVDMSESLETLGSALPAEAAAHAQRSIHRAARALAGEDLDATAELRLPSFTQWEMTPTQVLYTSDVLAGAEKLRKRRGKTKP